MGSKIEFKMQESKCKEWEVNQIWKRWLLEALGTKDQNEQSPGFDEEWRWRYTDHSWPTEKRHWNVLKVTLCRYSQQTN